MVLNSRAVSRLKIHNLKGINSPARYIRGENSCPNINKPWKMCHYLSRSSWSNYNLGILHYAFLNNAITDLTLTLIFNSRPIKNWEFFSDQTTRDSTLFSGREASACFCCYATKNKNAESGISPPMVNSRTFVWQNYSERYHRGGGLML